MNAIMKPVAPQICKKIADGECSVLLTTVLPKMESPYKIYLYCPLPNPKKDWDWQYKPHLYSKGGQLKWIDGAFESTFGWGLAHQKVIGEVTFDNAPIQLFESFFPTIKRTGLSWDEIKMIAKGKPIYGLEISNIKIFDRPKKIDEFRVGKIKLPCGYGNYNTYEKVLLTPPRHFCYVNELTT